MMKRVWKTYFTLVNVAVGMAILMVLSGLVIPIFVPPQGKAATAVATSCAAPDCAKR